MFSTTPTVGPYLTIRGTVYVDAQGRVREVVTAGVPRPAFAGKRFVRTAPLTVTFSDFGVPVTVTAPPASEVTAEPHPVGCPR